jgi:hypothetical protein
MTITLIVLCLVLTGACYHQCVRINALKLENRHLESNREFWKGSYCEVSNLYYKLVEKNYSDEKRAEDLISEIELALCKYCNKETEVKK